MNIHIPSSSDMLGLPDLKTVHVFSDDAEKRIIVESLLERASCPSCTAYGQWNHRHGVSEQEFRDIPHGMWPTVLQLRLASGRSPEHALEGLKIGFSRGTGASTGYRLVRSARHQAHRRE